MKENSDRVREGDPKTSGPRFSSIEGIVGKSAIQRNDLPLDRILHFKIGLDDEIG